MAMYKVPQDVEADDKLIGPFSFRQFIYLIIVCMAIAAAWGLAKVMLPLAILPLPVILLFSALALPLRKDQPMETYLAAIVSFYLKPRRRLWEPDGIESLIEVTAPKTEIVKLTKDISQSEAERRLSYLAEIVDSKGWAVRTPGGVQIHSNAINDDIYREAQQTKDIMDSDNITTKFFDTKLNQSNQQHHKELVDMVRKEAHITATPSAVDTVQKIDDTSQNIEFNPYPTSIHQAVIQPLSHHGQKHHHHSDKSQPNTSETTVSPDIINLANNTDLSIQTIAHEAQRLKEKGLDEEVVISLR